METDNHETGVPENTVATGGWGRKLAMGSLAVVVLAGLGLASAKGGDFAAGQFGMGGKHEMGGKAMHASMRGKHFGERRLDYMLEEIDATPEQATRLKEIFGSVRDEVGPVVSGFRETRGQIADLLAAPTIDRAAAETLRAERIAAIDTASRQMTAAILDAAEVLTPEQRAQLAKHFNERGGHGRW